ncbi:MAG: AraC family transcriptional regulator [Pseudomonadota bacterium]
MSEAEEPHQFDSLSSADPLGEVLHLLSLTGTFYCAPELSAPWGIDVPTMAGQMVFVAITEGGCFLELETSEKFFLRPGQLLLLPHGTSMAMKSDPGADLTPLFDIPATRHSPNYETMAFGGGGALTRMICGVLKVDYAAAERLIELLPTSIYLDSLDKNAGAWLYSSLRFLAEEARDPKPGGDVVLTRLTDILVVQAIRAWLEISRDTETGWLAALRDPKVGRALQSFHKSPERNWTVEEFARSAGMSRSAFAMRFKQLTGEGAMQYATRWRMQLARMELKKRERPIAEISAQLGYESEAAFSRAFKRVIGETPGSYKRNTEVF